MVFPTISFELVQNVNSFHYIYTIMKTESQNLVLYCPNPDKPEITNHKHQIPNKIQSKLFVIWDFGHCYLRFVIWNFH